MSTSQELAEAARSSARASIERPDASPAARGRLELAPALAALAFLAGWSHAC